MKKQLLDQFPYAIMRVNAEHQVTRTNLQGQAMLERLNSDFLRRVIEDYSNPSLINP